MTQYFSYATLEQAIGSRSALETLCGRPLVHLSGFRVADYVADYRLRQRGGPADLTRACARVFFEDDAPLLKQIEDPEKQHGYAIVLFATFVIIEFNPFTTQAHFLVLAPALKQESGEQTPYAGLWAAQRMDALNNTIESTAFFEEIDCLIEALRRPPQTAPAGPKSVWWRRLLGR